MELNIVNQCIYDQFINLSKLEISKLIAEIKKSNRAIQQKKQHQTRNLTILNQSCYCKINQFIYSYWNTTNSLLTHDMNDFKIMLNKQQQHYLEKLLPKGYSFQLYKVRKNINNYPLKEFEKKFKKPQSIILNKKQSFLLDSIEVSEKSYKQRSQPSMFKEQLKKIQQDLIGIVRKMKKHQSSYPFRAPVDPKALQIPDYFDVILEPIDLKTIEDKIRRDQYEHVGEFQRDIYKMIMNSYKYNQKASSTEKKTIQFEEFFVQTMKQFREYNSKNQLPNDQKIQEKEEVINAKKELEESIKGHEGFKNENNKEIEQSLNSIIAGPNINPFIGAQNVSTQQKQKQKQQSKLLKVLTEMASQRPRQSRKQLSKPKSVSQLGKSVSPKHASPQVKKQQPQPYEQMSELSLPQQQLALSQQLQPSQQKDFESQQIKDEMKSYLENQTQNNRQQNFSEGYNEAALGCRIKNIEVQKQITSLLKKLSQFPLTKPKKNKTTSKFTNLEQNMTLTDKKKLFDKINKLDENDIHYVVRILTKGKCDINKQEEFDIDLDKADSKVLREVQNFIALRDQTFVNPNINIPENNGTTTPVLTQSQPVSCEVIKVPKKVKKEEKKIMKKKISRKNSNDDSFSLNPPPVKKKKSQKPSKKYLKVQEMSDINVQQAQSANEIKSQSSSYHPQPVHAQHHGRTAQGQHLGVKNQQMEKGNISKNFMQKQSSEQKPLYQSNQKQKPSQYYHSSHFQNTPHSHHHHNHQQVHNQDQKMYDIDQFLVSSRNYQQQGQQEIIPFSSLSFNKLKQPSNSIEHLDFMDDNFNIGNNRDKDYPDDEIREYSMNQNAKDQNDDDHFF